jgi:zinc D-Ala-D-Ala carboxypeptidase
MMDENFLELLDEARDYAGIPFVITSGFRSVAYNRELIEQGFSASKNSSHLLGLAADIRIRNSTERWIILDALLEVGVTRIGIGHGFIHADVDPLKESHVVWTY